MPTTDYIDPNKANTLPGLLQERVNRSAHACAYGYFDDDNGWCELSWEKFHQQVRQTQAAFSQEAISKGERVAIMLKNCPQWVMFDLAALSAGLVTVPLYTNDRAENVAYIIQDAAIKILLVQNQRQWHELAQNENIQSNLIRVLCLDNLKLKSNDTKLMSLEDWTNKGQDTTNALSSTDIASEELATIVYTSGTTGKPKGVMLSHKNILCNASSALHCGEFYPQDIFLSFLPLSHMLERTGGCYLPMMCGCKVSYARSVQQLADDLQIVCPTILISVPRIYEMIYSKVQVSLQQQSKLKQNILSWAQKVGWQHYSYTTGKSKWHWSLLTWPIFKKLVADKISQRLGGRLRYAIAGGAALSNQITKFFISLGVPIYQGYGMTEASPTISVGRQEKNDPFSIGRALPGVEVKITEQGELCTRSDSVMLGYFNNQKATQEVIDEEGWLHTGDLASINEQGYLFITGRIKDIIVLASAEKVPPQDIESAICVDELFDQAMVIGEGKPFLAALVVLNESAWRDVATRLELDIKDDSSLRSNELNKLILKRLATCLKEFPGYAQIRKATAYLEPWTIENGLLTPTLKTKRPQLLKTFTSDIEDMYMSLTG